MKRIALQNNILAKATTRYWEHTLKQYRTNNVHITYKWYNLIVSFFISNQEQSYKLAAHANHVYLTNALLKQKKTN